jgi:NAD(P)-dependent dehydrogenase (short-subunit alcohol dehydrogenase family)
VDALAVIELGFENRVVAVTGGNNPSGIGASTAKAFAAQGARVFLHCFRPPAQHKTADEVVKAIRDAGNATTM